MTDVFQGIIQSGKKYLDQGIARFKIKDYWGAMDWFSKAIEIDKNNSFAYEVSGIAGLSNHLHSPKSQEPYITDRQIFNIN